MEQRTREQIGAYCEFLKVPNWKERLDKKSADYIFDLGVLIVQPGNKKMAFQELTDQMDHLLRFETLDDASKDLRKKTEDIITNFVDSLRDSANVNVRIINLAKGDKFKTEQEDGEGYLKRKMAEAESLSKIEKISKLLAIGKKLGKDILTSRLYDRMDDLALHHGDYFNLCYAAIVDMMDEPGEHWKTCDCVGKKYDYFIYSDNQNEVMNKILKSS